MKRFVSPSDGCNYCPSSMPLASSAPELLCLHCSGTSPFSLTILVVDRFFGDPVAGAAVELIHEFDGERATVKGRTELDGRVVLLRNSFSTSGVRYVVGESIRVSFRPWLVKVDAAGYQPFCASIGALKNPIRGPFKIAVVRSGTTDISPQLTPWTRIAQGLTGHDPASFGRLTR